MAKKQAKVNVSEAIRGYIKDNPEIGNKAAAEEISKQLGRNVSATFVANIKSKAKNGSKGKRRKKLGRSMNAHFENNGLVNGKRGRGGARVNGGDGVNNGFVAAVSWLKKAVEVVGADQAKKLIDVLA